MLLIFKRVINFCWFCFKWGLVPAVIGVVVAAPYLYHRVDEEIRCQVEQRIARHYAGLKVTIRSAERVEGKGIEVRGLSILEPGAEGPRAELIYCDELFLSCATELQDLIGGKLQVTRITIRRATLRATRRPDGTWSVARLLPLPIFSKHPPEVTIEDGTVEIFDPLKTPASTLTLPNVNLTFSAPDTLSPTPHTRMLQGTLGGDHFRGLEVEGLIDPRRQVWTIGGRIEGLEISPELRDALPGPLAAKLAVLGDLRGKGALSFRVGYDRAAESPYRFVLSGRLVRGRIDDPRLPHLLTDLRATVRLNNDGFTIEELVARSGQATLRVLSAHQAGFELGKGPLALQAEIRQLELDRPLLDILPQSLQDQWRKYRPAGKVDADVELSYDGQTWNTDLSVRCLNVSFTHHKFPFRLEHGEGTVQLKTGQLKDDFLEVHLTAYSASQPVRLDARVLHPTFGQCAHGRLGGWVGWFEAKGDDLQLDEKLLVALPERPRTVVRSLNPHGTVSFYMRISRDGPEQLLRKHLLIGLNRCSIRYDKFAYPLSNIRGTIEMLDDHWTFHKLEGTNDTGRVRCEEGYLRPMQDGKELYLRLVGTDIPLEEELRDALAPNMQRVWNNLKPQGRVDLKEVVVRYLSGRKSPSVSVRARPQPDATSIEPVHFPYRMEKLRGELVYRDGHVTFEEFRAEHGRVEMAISGHCDFLPNGCWNLHLERLSVDRLHLDRELIQALPGRLKKTIVGLNPRGQIDLRGKFDLWGGARVGGPVRYGWDLNIGFHRGSIDCGIRLEQIYGVLTLAGGFDGRRFGSLGELEIDSLSYKDYQFTQLKGPVWIDDQQLLLGSWVDRRRDQGSPRDPSQRQPRPLTAGLFGGTVYGDGWITLGPETRYGLHATLWQGDLSRCAQEVMAGRQNLRGTILATVKLGGTGRSVNGLSGHGNISLREADIYELPLVIALLKILSIREPDRTAFAKSDIGFEIDARHIYFKPINLYGDAISLLGQGEMDFDSKINLTFHAVVGRDEWHVPVLRELMGGASQQIMQIHVKGTLQDPKTEKVALPFVKEVWEQLQNELQMGPNSQGLFPQARQWIPNVTGRGGNRR